MKAQRECVISSHRTSDKLKIHSPHTSHRDKQTLPNDFSITAKTKDGTIMGIKHKRLAVEGVQFHPESILTTFGKKLIKNIIKN